MDLRHLPGGDLIDSNAALLLSIGAPRLARAGIRVPDPIRDPEHPLYKRLHREDPRTAHSRYNALIRRLGSFERGIACAGLPMPSGFAGSWENRGTLGRL